MTSLFKSVSLLNKFTITDIKTESEDFVLGKAFIGSSRCGDSVLLATTTTLPFEGAKLLLGGKKTWLGARPKTLEAEEGQTLF